MTFDEMATILTGMFDETSATVQGWINEAYQRLVVDSGWLTEYITIASTVAGQASYALPATAIHLRNLEINGVEQGRVGEFDISDLAASNAYLTRSGGVYAQSSSPSGGDQVTLYPTPSQDGLAITGKAEQLPAALRSGLTPIVHADLHTAILNGAIAIGYQRSDELAYMAQYYDALYEDGITRARGRKRSKVAGRAQQRVRVQGYDFLP